MQKILLAFLIPAFAICGMHAQGTRLLRQPTISQTSIAFVYANDLWMVDRTGGEATRLTSGEGAETFPHFSPDGTQIAFTAQYDGNTDVYLIPTEGGEPQRLTWHPGDDVVQGWTPDGREIVFRSGRMGHATRLNRLWKISAEGGLPEVLPIPRAAYGEISPDGKHIAYTPITFWDPEWRNYRGGQAMPVWIVDLKTFALKRTPQPTNERHLDPVWHDGRVYFTSERDFASNIWSFDPTSDDLKQHTKHVQFDVKSLDACEDMIVYEQGGYLHLLDPKTDQSTQLEIHVRGDLNWARPRWEDVSGSRLTNASLSPTGKRALFEYRGDIFTVPKEHGTWRNLTRSPGVADRYPVWSPEGNEIAWFSDKDGEYALMIGDQKGLETPRKIEIPNPTFFFRPAWSPDGKHIAFTDTHYRIWCVEVATGKVTQVDTDGYAHPVRTMNPVWSPDSKWIAYAKQQDNQFKTIMAYELATGTAHQLTNELADAISPVWDKNGKYLYFLASTTYGLNTGWLDMSSYDPQVTRNLYCLILNKDESSPLLPKSDEEGENDKAKDKEEGENGKSKKDPATVTIDMDNLERRIVAMDLPARNYSGLIAGPEKSVFIQEIVPNQRGTTLHKYDLNKQKASEFLKTVQFATSSHDRGSLLYRSGSSWSIASTKGEKTKSGEGKLSLNLRMKVDPKSEYQQIYREGWRYQRDFLYVDNVHGAPWDKIYDWYKPWVEHVRHRSDLNYLVDILGGEVAIGHSYTRGGDYPDVDRISIGLLGADLEEKDGFYQIVKVYNGESWNPNLKAPLAIPGIDVKAGDYILAVNGVDLKAPTNPYSLFEGTTNQQTVIRVNDRPVMEGARSVTVVPVGNEGMLRNIDWIEGNRRKVDELSDGKIGYVYVPNTSRGGFTNFNRYYFAQQDKKGVVIDERNNGGGSAADYMVDVMGRKLHGYFNSKIGDRKPWTTPMSGIWGPKVMIINERAGSGGDLLPYMFRKMEIGPLIGTRTWGGLVGTWDTPPFLDGGRMVAPRGGFFDTDGKWAVEGEGIAPDIEVIQEPARVMKGEDPQLERAVEEALKLLKTEGIELKPEPAPPVRWKRPER